MRPYPDDLPKRYPGAQTFHFGDSAEMAQSLADLVIDGGKRATCGRLEAFPDGSPARPVVGRRDIVTDFHGDPLVVIETVDVFRKRFRDIGMKFACAEGENDDLAGWRRDHRAYFERTGGWSDDMWLLCERFEVVEILRRGEG